MSEYSYDRRTASGPASRMKDAEQYVRQGDRQIEQARGVLHGLVKEMGLIAEHTSNHALKEQFAHAQQFSHRLDAIDKEIDKLLADMDHALHSFK